MGVRVAVIGAAGSMGFAVAKLILEFHPKDLALFDLNESGLVEVSRTLKASPELKDVSEEFFRKRIPPPAGRTR